MPNSSNDRRRALRSSPVDPEARSADADPERAAIAADWGLAVQRLIDALPEELRQPLALSAIEELRSAEIAALMGISEGTVQHYPDQALEAFAQPAIDEISILPLTIEQLEVQEEKKQ